MSSSVSAELYYKKNLTTVQMRVMMSCVKLRFSDVFVEDFFLQKCMLVAAVGVIGNLNAI